MLPAPPHPQEDARLEVLLASAICETPIALISIVDAERQWFKARKGLSMAETPRDVSFCGHAILSTDVFEVPDTALDPRFADNPLATGEPYIRFYAGAPLINSEGLQLGTIGVIAHEPRRLSGEQKTVLQALARHVVALLELRSRVEERDRAQERYRSLFE